MEKEEQETQELVLSRCAFLLSGFELQSFLFYFIVILPVIRDFIFSNKCVHDIHWVCHLCSSWLWERFITVLSWLEERLRVPKEFGGRVAQGHDSQGR